MLGGTRPLARARSSHSLRPPAYPCTLLYFISITMDHFPTSWGRPVCFHSICINNCSNCAKITQRNDAYDAHNTYPLHQRPNHHKDAFADGVQRTQYVSRLVVVPELDTTVSSRQPIVTGTSVLAIKFKDGIMMAADTLGSYPQLPAIIVPNS